jgi:hypothetical protein
MNTELKLETSTDLLRRKNGWFQKVLKEKTVKQYLKEAKRVKYIVTEEKNFSFDVNDDETGEIVFCGVCLNAAFYVVMFNKKYWQDEIQEEKIYTISANDLETSRVSLYD